MTEEGRARKLRDMVKETWDPPFGGRGSDADIAQTCVMQSLAWVFGKEFVGDLGVAQEIAIDQGIEMFQRELGK